MSVFLSSRNNDSLYLRSNPAVSISDCTFILEVNHITHSSNYMPNTKLPAYIYCKSVIGRNFNIFQRPGSLTDNIQLLFVTEQSPFVLIDTDSNHHLIEHPKSPGKNI